MSKRRKPRKKAQADPKNIPPQEKQPEDPSKLEQLPTTYQALHDYYKPFQKVNLFDLRNDTFRRIEDVTGRPLICYVAKTRHISRELPSHIDDSDLTGFGDLIQSVPGKEVNVFISSNGGTPETTERIARLLRDRFTAIRFIVPRNAYSAATLLCFAGDEIMMGPLGTLGPIDPQINGVPARAILRAFERIEARLKEEGPRALTAYVPLLEKYELHVLELCRTAQELSRELAGSFLSRYLLNIPEEDPRITQIVDFFSDYEVHKSHGRSIGREQAREVGLEHVTNAEDTKGLVDLVQSLYNQYELMFDKSPFYKLFENSYGISWGRQAASVMVQVPVAVPPGVPLPVPQPGPPERSG